MNKVVRYELSEEEYKKVEYLLGLMTEKVNSEISRIVDINNKSQSDIISFNSNTYLQSLLYDLNRLL